MSNWPRESDATVAVEAAAKRAYDDWRASHNAHTPEWEDLGPVHQLRFREGVLPLVWAALEALPDPRREAWEEGRQAVYDIENDGWAPLNPERVPRNPYRSGQ